MSGLAFAAMFALLFSVLISSSGGMFITETSDLADERAVTIGHYDRVSDYRHANITIKKIVYDSGGFEVTVENTGGIVLDPDYVALTLDGVWFSEGEVTISMNGEWWEPAEKIVLTFTQVLEPGWHTLKVVTGIGVTDERRIYLPYEAMMVYYDSWAPYLPRYRLWNGSAWSDEGSAGNVDGDIRWVVLEAAPNRNEYALIILDANGDINGQVWQNGSWLGPLEIVAGINGGYRGFDIAYEQLSGDAVVVYSDGTSLPKYLVWNGRSVTQTGAVQPIGTGVPRWVVLASDPNSDEIVLVTLDTNRDIYAQVWDGDSWGNVILLESNAETRSLQCYDAVYEASSGRAMVVWADRFSSQPRYRIWDGSSWSAENAANDVGSSNIYWVKLASEQWSNRILLGTLDSANDINVQTWNGSQWGSVLEVTIVAENDLRRTFDVAFERSSGIGMISYGENNDRPRYRTCSGACNAGDWSGENSVNDVNPGGGDPEWIRLIPDPHSNDIMLMHADDGEDVGVQRWVGSAPWIDGLSAEIWSRFDYESFSLAYRIHDPGVYAWD
jgi:archaellum component FlaF (FlaF/FlaG flagellin family)